MIFVGCNQVFDEVRFFCRLVPLRTSDDQSHMVMKVIKCKQEYDLLDNCINEVSSSVLSPMQPVASHE